jgi:hypothetical protein
MACASAQNSQETASYDPDDQVGKSSEIGHDASRNFIATEDASTQTSCLN